MLEFKSVGFYSITFVFGTPGVHWAILSIAHVCPPVCCKPESMTLVDCPGRDAGKRATHGCKGLGALLLLLPPLELAAYWVLKKSLMLRPCPSAVRVVRFVLADRCDASGCACFAADIVVVFRLWTPCHLIEGLPLSLTPAAQGAI